MADFNALETLINAYIKKNGVQAITGNILNGVLRGMVSALGKGYTIVGVATPSTDPGTLTGPCAYYASTYGTYTNFGNIVVNDGEVAMLIYDEQTWHKEKMWRLDAEASVDANVGTPSVETSFEDELLTFRFHNIKGNPGDAAGFGNVNATVDSNIGTPGVSVQTSGPDTAKNMTFQFTNLKGETGVTSVVCTVDNTIGTPSCAVSLVGQELHLDFSGLKGAQGDTGVSADYPITIVNNLTTSDPTSALSAQMGVQLESEISQLDLELNGDIEISKTLSWSNGYVDGTSFEVKSSSGSQFCQPILLKAGETLRYTTGTTYGGAVLRVPSNNAIAVGDTLSATILINYRSVGITAEYTAAEDMYVVISVSKSSYSVVFVQEYSNSATENIQQIKETVNIYTSPNLFDKSTALIGYYCDKTTGKITANASWDCSQFIPVSAYEAGTKIRIAKSTAYSGVIGVAVYDATHAYLRQGAAATTLQTGDAYIIASIPASELDTVMIYAGDTAPDKYYPFGVHSKLEDGCIDTANIKDGCVTEEKLNISRKISQIVSFIGEGTTLVGTESVYDFAVGQPYRCAILTPNVSLSDTSGSSYRFILRAYDAEGNTVETIKQYDTSKSLPDYIDFVVPSGTSYIRILGRCVAGITFSAAFLPAVSAQEGDIIVLNSPKEFIPKLHAARKRYYTSTNSTEKYPLTLLHISDIHGNWDNVERFVKFANHEEYKPYIDDLINTGDTVEGAYEDGVAGFTSITGADKILNAIGNHDTRTGNNWQAHIGTDVYNMLIKPFVSSWNVTQPENAEANGYCYYYKDYANKNVRVVVVDIMSYDSTQDTWLAGVLADAKTAGKHVLIVSHFSSSRSNAESSEKVFDKIQCNYTTLYVLGTSSTQLTGYNANAYLMTATVDAFMQGGGHFVGYLQGHYHADFVAKNAEYPGQLIYSIGASKAGEMRDYNHIIGSRDQDEFQIVSIDPVNTIVKLFKVGANIDRYGRTKGSVCVDYSTGEIVGEGMF